MHHFTYIQIYIYTPIYIHTYIYIYTKCYLSRQENCVSEQAMRKYKYINK